MRKTHTIYMLILASTGAVGLLLYRSNIVEGESIFKKYDIVNANEDSNSFGKKEGVKFNAPQGENRDNFSVSRDKTRIVTFNNGITIDIGDGGGDISSINNIDGIRKNVISYNDNANAYAFNGFAPYINAANNSLEQNNNGDAIQNDGGNFSGGVLSGLPIGALETTTSAIHNIDNLTKNPTILSINIGTSENSSIPKNTGTETNTGAPANAETTVDEPSSLYILGGVTVFFGLCWFLVKRGVIYIKH